MQAISHIERGWARILVPVLAAVALASVAAGCGSSSTPTTPATTALPVTTTVAKKAPTPKPVEKIPASAAPRAKAYIAAHGADVKVVQHYESIIQTAIAEVVNSPLMTPLQTTTQETQAKIDKVLPRFKGPYKADALGRAEQQITVQANAIAGSMKTLLNYVSFPTPATLTEYTDQYQKAVLGWNKAIKAIWTVAKAPKPPVICTTC